LLLATLAVTAGMLAPAPASAAVVYSNRVIWSTEGGPCLNATDPSLAGHAFGTAPAPYLLNSVTLQLHIVTPPVTTTVYLYSDNAGQWGTQLATLGTDTQNAAGYPFVTYTPATKPVLQPNTTYWIVATTTDTDSCDIGWTDYEGGQAPTGVFTYVADGRSSSGSFQTATDDYLAIEIDADLAGDPVPALGRAGLAALLALLTGAGVILLRRVA